MIAARGGLLLAAIAQQRAQALGVLAFQRVGILLQMSDEDIQLVRQIVRVVQKQLRPHILVEPRHARHILKAAGGEAAALLRLGRLDVGARDDVRELRGKGDLGEIAFGGGHGHFKPGI